MRLDNRPNANIIMQKYLYSSIEDELKNVNSLLRQILGKEVVVSNDTKVDALSYEEACALYVAMIPMGLPDIELYFQKEIVDVLSSKIGRMYFDDYIDTIKPTTRNFVSGTLIMANNYGEKVFHKRFLDMTSDEIVRMLENCDIVNPMTVRKYIRVLSSYVDWCIKNRYYCGIHGINKTSSVNVSFIRSIKRTIIAAPEDLAAIVLNPYYWLLGVSMPMHLCLHWFGVENATICEIKKNDIDFDTNSIISIGLNNIPTCFMEVFKKYIDQIEISNELLYVPYRPRKKGDPNLKSKTDALARETKLLNEKLKNNNIEFAISASGLKTSGGLYQLSCIEKHKELTTDDYANVFQLSPEDTGHYTKLIDIKTLYREYKVAFNI